jgi:hypothetical protein
MSKGPAMADYRLLELINEVFNEVLEGQVEIEEDADSFDV